MSDIPKPFVEALMAAWYAGMSQEHGPFDTWLEGFWESYQKNVAIVALDLRPFRHLGSTLKEMAEAFKEESNAGGD